MVEADKIKKEVMRKEREELIIIKKNLWRKWRGKTKIMEKKNAMPKEIEKIQQKLEEYEKKIEEYRKKKEENLKKRDKRKEEWKMRNKMIVEDHWAMMCWLHKYTEDNKVEWEKRKDREKIEKNKEYEKEEGTLGFWCVQTSLWWKWECL